MQAREKIGGGRLSDLHDSILTQILSFLPISQSVRTSVLSKRWRRLWASVPDLDFDQSKFQWNPSLIDLVLARRDDSDVRRFVLKDPGGSNKFTCQNMTDWLVYATAHGVRHLQVDAGTIGNQEKCLSADALRSVFNCRSLEFLELNMRFKLLDFEPVGHLSKLRVLHLGDIRGSYKEDTLEKLIARCPVIEDLSLGGFYHVADTLISNLRRLKLSSQCHHPPEPELTSTTISNIFSSQSLQFLEVEHLHINPLNLPSDPILFRKLRRFHLDRVSGLSSDLVGEIISSCPVLEDLRLVGNDLGALNVSALNLKILTIECLRATEIRISCPRIVMFDLYFGRLKYFQGKMPSLARTSITFLNGESLDDVVLDQILGSLSHARILLFLGLPIKVCQAVHKYSNLEYLTLYTCFHYDNIELLIHLLESSPNLCGLTIVDECLCRFDARRKLSWTSRKLPCKFLDRLMEVEIAYFVESSNCREFVKFMSSNVSSWDRAIKKYTSSSLYLPAASHRRTHLLRYS